MGERQVSIIIQLKDQLTKPLSQVNKQFQALGQSVDRLKSAFGPLTGRITALVSAFAGLAAVRKGLQLAEVQAEAEARLAAALGGVGDEFERIVKLTGDIQARTTFGDEALIRVAALLAEAGLRGEQLNVALEATVQGSTAAQRSIDDFARTLIDTFTRGQIPEELTRFVGGLKDLDEAALRSGEAFRVIAEQFAGTAEALAATPFGRVIQLSNQLGDVFERLGDVLVEVKEAAIAALIEAFTELIEIIETPEFRALVRIFSDLARVLIRNLPLVVKLGAGIAAVVVTFKAAAIAIAATNVVLAAFTALLTPLGLITVAVVALGAAVVALTVDFEALGGVTSEVLTAISTSTISIADVFTLLANVARITFQKIKRFFLIPVNTAVATIITTIKFLASQAITALQAIAVGTALAVGRSFEKILQTIGSAIDFLTNTAADALDAIPGIADATVAAVRTTLGEAEFEFLDKLEGKFDELRDTAASQQATFRTEIDLLRQSGDRQLAAADAAIDALEKSQVDFFLKVSESSAKALEDTRKLEEEQQLIVLKRALQEAQLQDKITKIRTDKNKAAQEQITKLELVELEKRFTAQEISASAFIEARRELEQDLVSTQIFGLVKVRQGIEDQIAAQKAAGEDVTALLRQQVTIEERIQQLRFQTADLSRKTALERIELANQIQVQVTQAEQAIQEEIARNNELAEQGVITFAAAQQKNRAAIDELKLAIIAASIELENLLSDEDAGELERRLEGLVASFEEKFSEIESVSSKVGQDIARNLAPAFEDFFVSIIEGTKSTKQAFKDLLKDLLRQIIRFLVQRTIQAFLTSVFTPGVGFGTAFAAGRSFASGGIVPGPNRREDIVSAMLTPGEFVMKRGAVDHYGPGFMRALNQMIVPKELLHDLRWGVRHLAGSHYQRGGEVTPAATTQGPGVMPAFVVATERSVKQLLDGGGNALIRFIEDHRDTIKPILQG